MVVSIKNYVRHRVKYRSEFIAPKTHHTQMPHTWVALRLLWNDGCRLEILEKNPIVCDLQHRWVQKFYQDIHSHTHSKFLPHHISRKNKNHESTIRKNPRCQNIWVFSRYFTYTHNFIPFYCYLLLSVSAFIHFHFCIILTYIDQRWDAFVFRFSFFFFVSFSIIQQTTTKHNQITRKMMIIGAKDSINCIEL